MSAGLTTLAPGLRCFICGFGLATIERHHDLGWWDVKLDIPSIEYRPTLRVHDKFGGLFFFEGINAAAPCHCSLDVGNV
ncbi:MAG TPA: hypothetical protein VGF92_02835 [Stellaceae bacterium]